MAAKRTTLNGSVLVETVGTSLNITRVVTETEPPSVHYTIALNFADHTYLVDQAGEKVRLLRQCENAKGVWMDGAKAGGFNAMTITPEMVGMSLGDLIGNLWDQAINDELARIEAAKVQP